LFFTNQVNPRIAFIADVNLVS